MGYSKVNERNSLSYNNDENPTNKLYDHFKTLHSAPDPNTLSAFQIHTLNDKKRLEDSNHLQSGFSLKINHLTALLNSAWTYRIKWLNKINQVQLSTQLSIHKQSVNFKNPSTNHSEFIDHIRNPEHRHVFQIYDGKSQFKKQKLEDLQSSKLLKTLESVIIAIKIRLKMNCTHIISLWSIPWFERDSFS